MRNRVGHHSLDPSRSPRRQVCSEPRLADKETKVPRREAIGVRAQECAGGRGPHSDVPPPRPALSPTLVRIKGLVMGGGAVLGSRVNAETEPIQWDSPALRIIHPGQGILLLCAREKAVS